MGPRIRIRTKMSKMNGSTTLLLTLKKARGLLVCAMVFSGKGIRRTACGLPGRLAISLKESGAPPFFTSFFSLFPTT
jgi:hypothetical protein